VQGEIDVTSFINHLEQLLVVLLASHALAIAIVNLTPTPKDNDAVTKVYRVVEILAGLITRLAKK
jgi:hypothetical protein